MTINYVKKGKGSFVRKLKKENSTLKIGQQL